MMQPTRDLSTKYTNSTCSSVSKKKKIKINNPIKKWAEGLNRSNFLQRRHTDGQKAHEKMLNITNYWRNANQIYLELSPHAGQSGHHQEVYRQ